MAVMPDNGDAGANTLSGQGKVKPKAARQIFTSPGFYQKGTCILKYACFAVITMYLTRQFFKTGQVDPKYSCSAYVEEEGRLANRAIPEQSLYLFCCYCLFPPWIPLQNTFHLISLEKASGQERRRW